MNLETYETSQGFRVRRLQPAIGAEVSGPDLSADLSPAVVQDLRAALLAHGVIFLRGQAISTERHIELGRAFGDLSLNGSDPARPEIIPVRAAGGAKDQSASHWHTDDCFQAAPPSISILRAVEVKPFGGDTCFSSGVAAYEGLSEEMKTRIAPLRFTASLTHMLSLAGPKQLNFNTEEKWRELRQRYPDVVHPVVRVHPETGKPSLYANEGADVVEILGLEPAESRELLRTLIREIKRPEHQVRWNWENHALAIWDNRAVHHYGVPDQQHDRYLERVTVAGDRPISLQDWAKANRQPEMV